jgi:hypothetical protein
MAQRLIGMTAKVARESRFTGEAHKFVLNNVAGAQVASSNNGGI